MVVTASGVRSSGDTDTAGELTTGAAGGRETRFLVYCLTPVKP